MRLLSGAGLSLLRRARAAAPAAGDKILLEDGTSKVLQEDGLSKVAKEPAP